MVLLWELMWIWVPVEWSGLVHVFSVLIWVLGCTFTIWPGWQLACKFYRKPCWVLRLSKDGELSAERYGTLRMGGYMSPIGFKDFMGAKLIEELGKDRPPPERRFFLGSMAIMLVAVLVVLYLFYTTRSAPAAQVAPEPTPQAQAEIEEANEIAEELGIGIRPQEELTLEGEE